MLDYLSGCLTIVLVYLVFVLTTSQSTDTDSEGSLQQACVDGGTDISLDVLNQLRILNPDWMDLDKYYQLIERGCEKYAG